MNAREQRGLVIANSLPISQKGEQWIVPSQNGAGRYTVDPKANSCTCLDYVERGAICKHIHAVRFVITRETEEIDADGVLTTTT
jgi:hypothetical protein